MISGYPIRRLRRWREKENLRSLVRETTLNIKDFVYPMFITSGKKIKKEIKSMPEIYNFSIDEAVKEIAEVVKLGINAILLFGIPNKKDECGSEAYSENGIIQKAVREIKNKFPEILIITDVCLCEYTSHGHCGIVKNGRILNDETNELLAKMAVSHAAAGADIIAPSDMMDGRVKVIRESLDKNNYEMIPILSYSVKYASCFYAPFRDAAQSAPAFGDRRSHQLDIANVRESMLEAELDIEEGADAIMVKPALAFLDIIRRLREKWDIPIAAYNVSGEYSMVKAAAKMGWIDEKRAMMEILTSIKRAGADIIITYWAKEAAKILLEK